MLTSRTSCSAWNALWTYFDVPSLERVPANQYFREIFPGDIADNDVDKLLATIDFHPLSIHILAYTARECRWTGEELIDRWNTQQNRLLQKGYRKENLGFTIRLSLSSPSIQKLGDDAVHVLRIIAFFPQGVNLDYTECLFPSIPDISSLMDTLLKVSLVSRSGPFLTTLAPIRLFILDVFPTDGLHLLDDIRRMYYDSLEALSKEKDSHAHAKLVMSDHLNIEHLIAYDITHEPKNTEHTTLACRRFITGLSDHKARPTALAPIIPSLSEDSHREKDSKAHCLYGLGSLYFALSNYPAAGTACLAAFPLFVAIENHSMATICASNVATSYNNRGYFSRARQFLEDFIRSPSWQHLEEEEDKPRIYFTLDVSKMHTSPESADKLFVRSMDHSLRGLDSRVSHWQAKMYHGYSTPEEVERNLEPIGRHCMSSSDPWDRWAFLVAGAEAACLGHRFDMAMQLLDEAQDTVEGDFLLTLIVLKNKAGIASVQGDYDLSRSLLQHTLDTLSAVATTSSTEFLEMCYVHGRNELYAKNYLEARRLLANVISECDIQGNIRTKMTCMRAVGEAEMFLGGETHSNHYFAQTVKLCREAGVPPELLSICEPMTKLDDEEFTGWGTYLQAQANQ